MLRFSNFPCHLRQFPLPSAPISHRKPSMIEPTYGNLLLCSIKNISNWNLAARPGKMLFFVCTKALELLAIPLMAVVSLAWVPIGLPLLLLGVIVQGFDSQLGHALVQCGGLPLLGIRAMWSSTFGKWKGNYYFRTTDPDYTKLGLVIPTGRKIAQHIGILITTLALAAAVVTVVLFLATALVPLTFLWPMAIACGCVALIGLIAYGIARHGDWWKTFGDMPTWMRTRVYKRIDAVDRSLKGLNNGWSKRQAFLDFLSQCNEDTNPNVWKRIADALEILPREAFEARLSEAEKNPVLPLFQYCTNGDVLVRVLKLFRKRLPPNILRDKLLKAPNGELYMRIEDRAGENEAVRQAWNKLLRHAGLTPNLTS
jgi:hypothetical protein